MSNNYIKTRLKDFQTISFLDKQNAFKQVIQEIVLNCLEKLNFFKEAVFCGGTCLRIFYNLPRFSEDLDFSLIKPNKNFDLSKYFKPLINLLKAFGLELEVEKFKTNVVQSVFLKGSIKTHMFRFFDDINTNTLSDNQAIRIKIKVDTNPPLLPNFKEMRLDKPITSFVNTYDISTLFAGKVNAILTRMWKNDKVKGRDLYDFVFYVNNNIQLNIAFLNNALIQYGIIDKDRKINLEEVKQLLISKFKSLNYKEAKLDVINFIKNEKEIENWNINFFIDLVKKIK